MTGVLRITELIDSRPLGRLQFEVATLCALVALLDGFDTQVIAYVAPAITEHWGMAPSALGPVFGAGLLGLMAGALIGGGIMLAALVRRYGPYRTLGAAFVLVGGIVAALANVTAVPRLTMPAIFLAGAGVVGAQFCLNALAAEAYPTAIRATGVGWALGIGRIGSVAGPLLGGLLLGWGWSPDQLVLACAIPALVTAAAIFGLARLSAPAPAPSSRNLLP